MTISATSARGRAGLRYAALLAQVFRGTVLDAGDGSGRVGAVLEALGASPLLIDLSADMLAAGPRSMPQVRADLTALPSRTPASTASTPPT